MADSPMKIFKKIVIGLGLFLLVIIGVGLILPSSTQVSRNVIIERDISSVFNKVNDYREFNKWSPWAKRDPETRYEFTGPATGVGSKMSWHSDHPQVGIGSQEIIESIKDEKVTVKLYFEGQGDATAYYRLEQQGKSTRITWGFTTEHGVNIISRYFGLMLDSWVGADYEAGLENLKQLLEATAKT